MSSLKNPRLQSGSINYLRVLTDITACHLFAQLFA
jgi:hypothetical protein